MDLELNIEKTEEYLECLAKKLETIGKVEESKGRKSKRGREEENTEYRIMNFEVKKNKAIKFSIF